METIHTEATQDGAGIPVELGEVGTALDQLWGPAAEKAGGPELDSPAVTRVVLANVVLVNLGPDRPGLQETISAITLQYPSRLIVLRPDPGAGRKVLAEVSAQCHLPAPGRPQVCSEQIILRSSPEGQHLLPGAVRSLVESDLHSVLWWCDAPGTAPGLFDQLIGEATRVVLDLPDPGTSPAGLAKVVAADKRGLARDLAWFGLTTWRGLIADLFDPPATMELRRIASIRVVSRAPCLERPPREAAWLIGWLAGQLGWQPGGSPRATSPGRVEATFRGPDGPVSVTLESSPSEKDSEGSPQIIEVEIGLRSGAHQAGSLAIQCDGKGTCEIRVIDAGSPGDSLPRLVKAPVADPALRVSAALMTDRTDPPYHRALPITLWLLDHPG